MPSPDPDLFPETLLSLADPLQDLRAVLCAPTDDWASLSEYARANHLDLGRLASEHLLALRILNVRWFAGPRFEFADEYASPAVVMEVFEADGETVADLVAWQLQRPEKFGTALGRAEALGIGQVDNPATYHAGAPLLVHRTPLGWLQHGCRGTVILNPMSAPRWLGACPGQIAAEDVEHGRELARLLHPYFPPARILVPQLRGAAA
jgi:hypothetical protein